ncbi:hypothetical protein P691DRAFT_780776 [Macrolepiota fuliginosa MF-IS2]|uniref:Uncharacterized protein n=1 Tax=Macrolepiota fuliginosa MF-IS2 TaxID=1400762 RepID=A0A9P6BX29_9AGAR|nr:hypothetical protein P691DRAFT_780776 [Macrolepiota fuliginosa MF-IS2]
MSNNTESPVTQVPPDPTQTDNNGPLLVGGPVFSAGIVEPSTTSRESTAGVLSGGIEESTIFVSTTIARGTDATSSPFTFTSQVTFTRPVTSTSATATTTGLTTQAQTDATGPSKAIIGGIAGGAVTIILALVAFCAFRRTRRKRKGLIIRTPDFEVSDTTEPQQSQAPTLAEASGLFIPHPFLSLTSEPQDSVSAVKRREKDQIQSLPSRPQHNQEDVGNIRDPFQDPEVQSRDPINALDRIQELTGQLEMELQQLNNLARSGQLSEAEHTRLEEIRHTTGLTIPFDQRHGLVTRFWGQCYCERGLVVLGLVGVGEGLPCLLTDRDSRLGVYCAWKNRAAEALNNSGNGIRARRSGIGNNSGVQSTRGRREDSNETGNSQEEEERGSLEAWLYKTAMRKKGESERTFQ